MIDWDETDIRDWGSVAEFLEQLVKDRDDEAIEDMSDHIREYMEEADRIRAAWETLYDTVDFLNQNAWLPSHLDPVDAEEAECLEDEALSAIEYMKRGLEGLDGF